MSRRVVVGSIGGDVEKGLFWNNLVTSVHAQTSDYRIRIRLIKLMIVLYVLLYRKVVSHKMQRKCLMPTKVEAIYVHCQNNNNVLRLEAIFYAIYDMHYCDVIRHLMRPNKK